MALGAGCQVHNCSYWYRSASKSVQPLCFVRSQSLGLCEKFCCVSACFHACAAGSLKKDFIFSVPDGLYDFLSGTTLS